MPEASAGSARERLEGGLTALEGRRALVTGASAGIGRAVAVALAEAGMEVHAAARRGDRLEALAAETGAIPHVTDVTDPAARARLVAAARPEILVLNAGTGAGITGLLQSSAEEIERMVATNLTAALDLVRLAAPAMGEGHIVTLGSVAGLYPNLSAAYGATKAGIRMMGQNLRAELAGTGIRVTEILPGRVRTEFYDAAIPDAETRESLKETGIAELAPEDIAAAILWALTQPLHVNVSAIELQPRDQIFGGVRFVRARD